MYCKTSDVRERLYVRVLPGLESISLCMHNDITGKHILALQGPFSTQLNEALIDQYDIRCLVTKKSGAAGGFIEKIAAAKNKIFRSILWDKACRMMECHLKLFVNILTENITGFISCLPALEWEMMLA